MVTLTITKAQGEYIFFTRQLMQTEIRLVLVKFLTVWLECTVTGTYI